MATPRIGLALDGHGLVLPDEGRILALGARGPEDLQHLPKDRLIVVQHMKPGHDALEQAGFEVCIEAEGTFEAAIIFLPRAKAEARATIAAARSKTDGVIVLDGQKTDGIESVIKDMRRRADLAGSLSKAHGKIAWFENVDDLADWADGGAERDIGKGFVTRAGVFSADGIDPGSKMLAAALPEKLGRSLADLGAGWGYLAREALTRDTVEALALVEADHHALDCARRNVPDPRATFHWADATTWGDARMFDTVLMNPPFHTSRTPDPALGRAFIANAARLLKGSGSLWMVANRHLPYEAALGESFGDVREVVGDARFKVFHASRPRSKGRGR